MIPDPTAAINWLKLLHAYAPGIRNFGAIAEKLPNIVKQTGVTKLHFNHPAKEYLLQAIAPDNEDTLKNVIILGTAGDGKTSLMLEGKEALGSPKTRKEPGGIERFDVETSQGPVHFIFIYDLSGWRGDTPTIPTDCLELIYKLSDSVAGESKNHIFVIAANDGALHQVLNDDLPADAPPNALKLRETFHNLHEESTEIAVDANSSNNLRLINLSMIQSEEFMLNCLEAILDRPEWQNLAFGTGTGILGANSSVVRNYQLLKSPTVRSRLLTLAKLADACGYHLSIRDLLCLVANALLGHPKAPKGVLTPDTKGDAIIESHPDEAPLHKLLFGDSLPEASRSIRPCFEFLSRLQIGRETTNELDDLLIFGGIDEEDQEMTKRFQSIVNADPLQQRDKNLNAMAREYVTGDMDDEANLALREALTAERKRLFLLTDQPTFDSLELWNCTAFHHAGIYLREILDKLREGEDPPSHLLRKIIGGLNRIWTGFFLKDQSDALYLCTGLDVTTAPVSDIYLGEIKLDGPYGDNIRLDLDHKKLPRVVFDQPGKPDAFAFRLTLQRFEFLMRVANGAMPTSFSRESTEDFAVLKQRCIQNLFPSAPKTLRRVAADSNGNLGSEPIHFH
jgi:hypothetical protein